MVRIAYRLTALEREVRRPWFVAANIADRDKLERMERVDRFQNEIEGYAGRAFRQLAVHVTVGNELATGRIELGGRVVDLADVDVPVLALGGTDDVLAPIPSVEPVTSVLSGAPCVRFVRVPGTHLGILAGTAAPTTSWAELAEFLDHPLGDDPDPEPAAPAADESMPTTPATRAD